jgi:hypothetical protein
MAITSALIGQSLAQEMSQVSVNPPAPSPNTSMFYPGPNIWGAVTGNGAITYCNAVSAALAKAGLDPTVRLYNAAIGGNGLLAGSAPSAHAFWLCTASDGPLQGLYNQVAAGGYMPDLLEYNGCQQDYLNLNNDTSLSTTIQNGMGTLYSMIRAQWNKTAAELPLTAWVPGKASYGQVGSQLVMDGIIKFATSTAGAKLGPSYYDLHYVDGTHLDAAGYGICGERAARMACSRLGVPAYENAGAAQIVSIDRAGARLILNVTAGHCLVPQMATGFGVWSDDFTVQMPIASVRSAGERILLDMASHPTYGNDPPWRVRVAYQWDNAVDATWPMFDDQPMPLTPCPMPIQSSS